MPPYFFGDDDGQAGYSSGYAAYPGNSGPAGGGAFGRRAFLPGNPGKPNDVDGDWIILSLTPNRDRLSANHPHQLLSDNELWGVQQDRRIPYWRNMNTGQMVYDHPGRPAPQDEMARQGFTTMPGIVGMGNVMQYAQQAGASRNGGGATDRDRANDAAALVPGMAGINPGYGVIGPVFNGLNPDQRAAVLNEWQRRLEERRGMPRPGDFDMRWDRPKGPNSGPTPAPISLEDVARDMF